MTGAARILAVGAAGAAALALAGGASAALFFTFSPTTAKPGDRVMLRIPGTPARFDVARDGTRQLRRPMRIFLVRNAVAGSVRSPRDRRLHAVGSMIADRDGRGLLRFTLPRLPPGMYAVAVVCPDCATYSNGHTFFVLQLTDQVVPRWRRLIVLRVR